MVLGFMQKFPWGEPTYFSTKILLSVYDQLPEETIAQFQLEGHKNLTAPKFHTIREKPRFKPGDKLHMAYGVRSKKYFPFNKGIPALEKVVGTQRIDIVQRKGCKMVSIDERILYSNYDGTIGKKEAVEFGREWLERFVLNDGLTEETFWRWFREPLRNGEIVHWTPLKY